MNNLKVRSKNLIDEKILTSLKERNFDAEIAQSKEQALSRIKELIPAGGWNGRSMINYLVGL